MQKPKTKILLYNPQAVFYDMPLALISLGSQVCDRFEVIIIDARMEENPLNFLDEHLPETLLVGITSLTGAPLADAIQFSREVKRRADVPVIWGGWHTSLFPEKVLKEIEAVDISVVGQGEQTFLELVSALEKDESLEEIRGIVYRNGKGEIVKNPPRVMVDMNELPRLNYDLIDMERYFRAKGRRQFDFIASIGCFFRCTFCADPFVFQRKYSGLLPDRLIADLLYYHERYHFDDLNFQDETFFTYRDRVVEMARQLIAAGKPFTWAGTMRADQGGRMQAEDLKLCKDSGLRRLLIGVESGSQEMMDWLKKDIKMEQVEQCATWAKDLDLQVIFPFIVGFPGETEKSVEESTRFIRKLALMSPRFETPIFYFKPYPGTSITDAVVQSGEYRLPERIEEWAEFDYVGSRGPWVNEEKYRFIEKFKFYLRIYRWKKRWMLRPIAALAGWRIRNFNFAIPIDKWIIERIFPAQKLS